MTRRALGKRRCAGGMNSAAKDRIRQYQVRRKVPGDAWTGSKPRRHRQGRHEPFCVHLSIRQVPGRDVLKRNNGQLAGLHLQRARAHLQREQRCANARQDDVPDVAMNCHAVLLRRVHLEKGAEKATTNSHFSRPAAPVSTYSSLEMMATAGSATGANAEALLEMTFAEVLRANQSMVFSLAYHFLRDPGAAEEVAQDVFLQLYGKINELEDAKHVTFWLRKVTSHRSIDYARKRGSRFTVALEDVAEPSVAEPHGDPLLNRRLRQLIAALPEKPRMVMVLRYQEDLMPEEISELLDMPVRTVKSHLQRSLGMLREKIDRSMGDIR